MKKRNSGTLLDGDLIEDGWYYAIGQSYNEPQFPNCIPAMDWEYNEHRFHEVNLYMKIVDTSLVHQLFSLCSVIKCRRYMRMMQLLSILVCASE